MKFKIKPFGLMLAVIMLAGFSLTSIAGTKSSAAQKNPAAPFNAVAILTSGGGTQILTNNLYPYLLTGTPVLNFQIHPYTGGYALVRRGFDANGGAVTEYAPLSISNEFLLYNPVKFRTCFNPDCEPENDPNKYPELDGLGNFESPPNFGFCQINTQGNACNCYPGGGNCTFGLSGEPVGFADVILNY